MSNPDGGLAALKTMVRLGEAKTYLAVAQNALHAAMAVTPLGMEAVAEIQETAARAAAHLKAHREVIGEVYAGARALAERSADQSATEVTRG